MAKRLRCVDDPGIVELADGLKVISDPNRLRILCLLLRGERCVWEVEQELEISQQLASHHLNVLKESGLLEARREGTSTYYSVVEDRLDNLTEVFVRYLGYRGGRGGEDGVVCCAATSTCSSASGRTTSRRGGG
ncbi:MAG: metalloregulator ArsR/SmtB family transcription factor [Candidatus Thermoplasmatota archaeon]|nr:metalloregulator ArsR/SmtB family transcription factor [Candidatus Thermoplasmatota archaeon]